MQKQLGLWREPDIHDILFDNVCLIFDWLYFLFVLYMRLFWISYWANFISHRGVLACYPGTLSISPFLKFHEYSYLCVPWAMFAAILDCLDAYLIILDKMHVVCHISELTIDVLW